MGEETTADIKSRMNSNTKGQQFPIEIICIYHWNLDKTNIEWKKC